MLRRIAGLCLFGLGLGMGLGAGAVHGQWTTESGLRLLPGFELTELYKVPAPQGSWVSLTVDPAGRLIASDQYGQLYRVTLDEHGSVQHVQAIPVNTGRAHGLLYAFNALYVMSHEGNGQPSGLYRVTDSDADGELDRVELLRQINGSGEHGPHAIVLSPDGQSLYLCAGNHTTLPELADSRVPRNWQEDQLLPRMWDAGGHAVGILAPGGWVVKTDPDGKSFELISSGFRNEYDIAFDANGELFTFDSDMEWDVGLPWYRPTRICHLTSGSEFGWRSGSGKWPAYYPDSLPAAVDIGTASPTGVLFGTGARFPARYQRALFACDWSYGIIYAIHLTAGGASYTGEREVFCTAPGLAVTDLVIRPEDGAMYFLIGGRQSQSALFRIDYRGEEATAAAQPVELSPPASVRRHLEALHTAGPGDAEQVLREAWPRLADSDRFIRYAARVAIERMPVESWQAGVWKETETQASLESALALTRCGTAEHREPLLEKLCQLNWDELTAEQRLHWLRTAGLALIRLGAPAEPTRQTLLKRLEPLFPANEPLLDRELCRLLVALQSAEVAARTVPLIVAGRNQEEQIHFAYCLRSLRAGWTPELMRQYLEWFPTTGGMKGGNSFTRFLENIRAEATADYSDADRRQFAALINQPIARAEPKLPEATRALVRNWELGDFADLTDSELLHRDLSNGEQMFMIGQCYKCHQLAGSGGSVGPDLTAAGRRFNSHDLLETLLLPSKEVSDQYRATTFQLEDGRVITGRIANLNGGTYMVQTNMLDPGNFTHIDARKIEAQRSSEVSMMPKGLLDTMTRDDVLDLLAYLRAASDAAMTAGK